jgi:hypothetical protein
MREEATLTENVITHPENHEPTEFTLAMLDWLPWLAPPTEDALTERQRASLVDPARSRSAYFRLLASDPDILEARTRTDACRVPNANWQQPQPRDTTGAFTAHQCMLAMP